MTFFGGKFYEPFWGGFRGISMSFLGEFCLISLWFLVYFSAILGGILGIFPCQFWEFLCHFGDVSGDIYVPFWGGFGTLLCHFWGHFGIFLCPFGGCFWGYFCAISGGISGI